MRPSLDWLLLGRYALLIALTPLIPVPLLDGWVERRLRRRMVRAIAQRHDIDLEITELAVLADPPSTSCIGCLGSLVLWPFKKFLRTLLIVFQAKAIADAASEVLHRGLMLEEALEQGWLPGDAERVRQAMDTALSKVDTRPVERRLRGTFQDHRHELNLVIHEATRVARERLRRKPAQLEDDALGPDADELSSAMAGAIRAAGGVPELLYWFRAEMGAAPKLAPQVSGPVEADAILPSELPVLLSALAEGPPVEDAVEVDPRPEAEARKRSADIVPVPVPVPDDES